MAKIGLLIFIFHFMNLDAFAQCNIEDYKGLRALYQSTNGDNWKNNSNWDIKSENPSQNCNLSKFYGVYLDGTGRVNLISLGQNNLTGQIPKEIQNLTNLNTLWLNQNKLTGIIPNEIGNLIKLERLALSYNDFSGILPNDIYKLLNLKELSIESNKLTGSLGSGFKNFSKLERILVDNNNFAGFLPAEIGNLLNLKELTFHNNNFEGCFPLTYKNLCSKKPNFSNNLELANWQIFCDKSICQIDKNYKEVTFTIDTLFVSQSKKRKQLIFISEGFRKEEFPKFKDFVIKMTSKLKTHFPGISFDAVLVNVPSNESGVSNTSGSPAVKKDTYFETDLSPNSYGQGAVFINEKIAFPFIKHYFPESIYPTSSRIITYIVNTDIFGAYSAAVEGASTNYYIGIEQNTGTAQDAEWVFAHELGHFFGHADIQDAHEVPQGEWANATRETDRTKIKWRSFIKDSTPVPTPKNSLYDDEIGLFSVEDRQLKPTGWYRPCNNKCIMRIPSAHENFCKVCANHLNRNDDLPFANVENGKYGGYFYAGNRVTIQANTPDKSLIFSHWEGNGVNFENISNPKTTFVMPSISVNIKAIYKNIVLANEQLSESISFQVFPNPFNNSIQVNFTEPIKKTANLNLVNLIGTIVKEWTTEQQDNIFDILELPSGIYFLKCEINDKIETIKLVKY